MGLGQVPVQGGGVPPLLNEHHCVRRFAGEVVVVEEAAILGADGLLVAGRLHRQDQSRRPAGLSGVAGK